MLQACFAGNLTCRSGNAWWRPSHTTNSLVCSIKGRFIAPRLAIKGTRSELEDCGLRLTAAMDANLEIRLSIRKQEERYVLSGILELKRF